MLRSGFSYKTICGLALSVLCSLSVAQSPPLVQVADVVTTTFSDRAEALGTLRADESVIITATVTETVTAIHFEDGQAVKAGALLVEMTNAEEHALLEEAQSTLREAERQLRRIETLVKAGTASASLLDQRRRDFDSAQARLLATQSRLKDRIVTAPFDGTVGLRNISVGTLVRPGDLITTLTDNRRMKLDFTVPSVFLASLTPGLKIEASTSAYRGQAFSGKVDSVDNQIDPVTRAIRVRAILPNDGGLLKQGLLMNVVLHFNPREAITIPEHALLPSGNAQFVMRVQSESDQQFRAEKRRIEIGGRRAGEVEVVNGLVVGDRVVTHGAFKLKDGASIRIEAMSESASVVGR